jgi:phospholipid/cholesterol/gamma-HCH transport system permease protein
MNPLQPIGAATINTLQGVGRFALFGGNGLRAVVGAPFYGRVYAQQLFRIGWLSLPVVGLTALFTGAVLALQIYTGGSRFNAEQIVPSIVLIAILRELGPVLAGLMVAGRVSAAMAAELGTMRVSEQIDALTTLSVNPMRYLIAPRLWVATLTMPLLVLVGDIVAVAGGKFTATLSLRFNGAVYMHNTIDAFLWQDLNAGLIKAAVFGFVIALSGCYAGFHCQRGAAGVGVAATTAVVQACVLILACNYLLTAFLMP